MFLKWRHSSPIFHYAVNFTGHGRSLKLKFMAKKHWNSFFWFDYILRCYREPCFSLELEIFKSTTTDGEPAPAMETPSMSEHFPHDITWNLWKTFKAFFSCIINLLLTKLARNRTGRISALGLLCTDRAQRSVRAVKTSGRYSPSAALTLG